MAIDKNRRGASALDPKVRRTFLKVVERLMAVVLFACQSVVQEMGLPTIAPFWKEE